MVLGISAVAGIKWQDRQRDVGALLRGVRHAADFAPTRWVPSILGGPASLLPPYGRFSEYRHVVPGYGTVGQLLRYWPDVILPSAPMQTPDWAPSAAGYVTYRPSTVEQLPDKYGTTTSYPDEAWFFINGILTNDSLARVNAQYLAYLFRRPVSVVHNATSGMLGLVDLMECAVGKVDVTSTEAAKVALPPIHAALTDPGTSRVVLIAHSQGTIIASNVLERLAELARGVVPPYGSSREGLRPLLPEEIAKLEVYCFANCATKMRYHDAQARVPWIESYANEWDLVARLGAIAPAPAEAEVEIDGPVFLRRGATGHLLNEHYLMPVEAEQLRGQRPGGDGTAAPYELVEGTGGPGVDGVPRLYSYLNGGRLPEPARTPRTRPTPRRRTRRRRPRCRNPGRRAGTRPLVTGRAHWLRAGRKRSRALTSPTRGLLQDPAHRAGAGLIDTQHRCRLRLGQPGGRGGDQRPVRRAPAHPVLGGHVGDRPVRPGDRRRQRDSQHVEATSLIYGTTPRSSTESRLRTDSNSLTEIQPIA